METKYLRIFTFIFFLKIDLKKKTKKEQKKRQIDLRIFTFIREKNILFLEIQWGATGCCRWNILEEVCPIFRNSNI